MGHLHANEGEELAQLNDLIDRKYAELDRAAQNSALDAEIARLEERAARIIEARGKASVAPIRAALDAATTAARELLRKK